MDGLPAFAHEPLDQSLSQIRLISVVPEADGAVHCTLRLIDLDTNPTPEYRALSYTWGPPSLNQRIIVNGRTLTVRQNLYDFLIAFRKRLHDFRGRGPFDDEIQWLWVDQICIDQSIVEERNHQVRMMSSIYRRALYVYVWLGASETSTETAMKTLKCGHRDYHTHRYSTAIHHGSASGNRKGKRRMSGHDPSATDIGAVQHFFHNPYWIRLWIVQEVMLARYIRIMCGDTYLQWEELKRFCLSGHNHLPSDTRLDIPSQVIWLAEHALSAKEYSYMSLLQTFSKNECQNPRDKVYGFQGLLFKSEQTPINYANSVKRVFEDATRTLWEGARTVTMTSYVTLLRELDYCEPIPVLFTKACSTLKKEQEHRLRVRLTETLVDLEEQMGVAFTESEKTKGFKEIMQKTTERWDSLGSTFTRDYLRSYQPDRRADTTEERQKRQVQHAAAIAEQKNDSFVLDQYYKLLASTIKSINNDFLGHRRLKAPSPYAGDSLSPSNTEQLPHSAYLADGIQRTIDPWALIWARDDSRQDGRAALDGHVWLNGVEDPEPYVTRGHFAMRERRELVTFDAFAAMDWFRLTLEDSTRHLVRSAWQYDLALFPPMQFNRLIRENVENTNDGRTTRIEYSLRNDLNQKWPKRSNESQMTLRIRSSVPAHHIKEVKTVFRGFSGNVGSLILYVTTEEDSNLDGAGGTWDLSFNFDLSSSIPNNTRKYATCIIFRSTKPPKRMEYRLTPEAALAQDSRIQAKTFGNLGNDSLTQLRSGTLTLWRSAAVGCS